MSRSEKTYGCRTRMRCIYMRYVTSRPAFYTQFLQFLLYSHLLHRIPGALLCRVSRGRRSYNSEDDLTLPGKKTSMDGGISYLQSFEGYISIEYVSTAVTSGSGRITGSLKGFLAHEARPTTCPLSPVISSFGRLTTIFLGFVCDAGGVLDPEAAIAAGGIGLTLRFGPPKTALEDLQY